MSSASDYQRDLFLSGSRLSGVMYVNGEEAYKFIGTGDTQRVYTLGGMFVGEVPNKMPTNEVYTRFPQLSDPKFTGATRSRARMQQEREEAAERTKRDPSILKREEKRVEEEIAKRKAAFERAKAAGKESEYHRARAMERGGMNKAEADRVMRNLEKARKRKNANKRNVAEGRGTPRIANNPAYNPAAKKFAPLYNDISEVEETASTAVKEVEEHSNVVSRYLHRVGDAFQDQEHLKSAAMRAVRRVDKFFNSINSRNPISAEERNLIQRAIDDGGQALSEGERRLVVSAIAHTDDTETLLELAHRYDSSVKIDIGTIDITRLRRFVVGQVLGEEGHAELQRVAKSIRDQAVSPATEVARHNVQKKNVVDALLNIGEDPAAAAHQSDEKVLRVEAVRRRAGVTRLNPSRVQHQVTVSGRQYGFDMAAKISIDDILADRQLPLHQRKYTNLVGYTTAELKKMRESGQQYIGLGIKGGDVAELQILEGFGKEIDPDTGMSVGKQLNVVYHADKDQIRSRLAADADRVVMIDSENTFGRKVRFGAVSAETDQIKSRTAEDNFKKWMANLISEKRDKYKGQSQAKQASEVRKEVAEAVANYTDEDLSRVRSLSFVSASKRARESFGDANMSNMAFEEGAEKVGRFGLFNTRGKVVQMSVDVEALRKKGDIKGVGRAFTEYIDAIEGRVREGYVVEGFNIHHADLEWLRRDAYRTANELIAKNGGDKDAVALANRLFEYTGAPTIDSNGNFAWGQRVIIDKTGKITHGLAGADKLLLETRDVQKDIRAMLPAAYFDKGKYVRGYDLGDGMRVSLAELMSDKTLKPIAENDFKIMYGAEEDVTKIVKGMHLKEGMNKVNKVLGTTLETEEELDEWMKNFVAKGGTLDWVAEQWTSRYSKDLKDSLATGGGASADELYVLFYDQLPGFLKGSRHEDLPDAMRQVFYVQRARETFQKTGRYVLRTIEDRMTGRLNQAVDAIKEFVGKAQEPIKIMLTEPKEGAKGAYQNISAYVKDIFTASEPVTGAHRMQMASSQMAAYSKIAEEALSGGDLEAASQAAKRVVSEAGDIAKAGLYAARQRKALTAAVAVGIGVAAGTAIRRRKEADASWRYGETWSAQDERNYNQRLNDPTMGRLTLETSRRRSNHHNMKPDRNKHLFRG